MAETSMLEGSTTHEPSSDMEPWADEVMAVVADVDWASLAHAYGPAVQAPLALRTWLSGDDRSHGEVESGDEVWAVIVDYESPTVAESALAWITVSVFHQGSLYPASAPICRAMVAAFELSPVPSIRVDALGMLFHALTRDGYDTHEFAGEWLAAGFHRLAFRNVAVYDAIEAGWPLYLQAIDREENHEIRDMAALMLAWMSEREACAEGIIDVLSDEPEDDSDDLGALDAAMRAHTTSLLLRSLGLIARETEVEEQAELGIRSYLDEGDKVGLAACLSLARLRRVDEADTHVVERLENALEIFDRFSNAAESLLDALMTIALHCAPRWQPDSDRRAAAKQVGSVYLQRLADAPVKNESHFAALARQADQVDHAGALTQLSKHHRLDSDAGELVAVEVAPQHLGRWAKSAPVDLTRFALSSGKTIHLISVSTLQVDRTLTIATPEEFATCVVGRVVSSRRESMGDAWREQSPIDMSPGEMATSPDGRWLAAYGTGQVAVWDLHRAQSYQVANLCGFSPSRVEFAWSPDSSQLVTAEAGDLHFWSVDDWSAPTEVVVAISVQRLAWTGRHPFLFNRDRLHHWNIDTRDLERVELPNGENPIGVGPNGQILTHREPRHMPVSTAAARSDGVWARLDLGRPMGLAVGSPEGTRRIDVGEVFSDSVWWWPDGSMFAHQSGTCVTFRTAEGDAIVTCTLVDPHRGDLAWLAQGPDGEPRVSTTMPGALNWFVPQVFDRPDFVDNDDGLAELLATAKATAEIAQSLRR